jgi:tetratricopeptide (TPR) repeat protein
VNEISSQSGGVSYGDNASKNIAITGGWHIHEAPARVETALHQLPPPLVDFTGREAELAEMLVAIKEGTTTLGLRGQGGVGKTMLALKLADKIKERYPDGQFYIDLNGVGPQPLTPAEAMTHVIQSCRPGVTLPGKEAELRSLYLSVLYNQRALLLMDNAKDESQVEPLIPPAGCALLVTSRQHFTLPGMFAKNIDSLPPVEACQLLLAIAPQIGDTDAEIARLCGHLPLALRLAANAIANRPNLKPADYARRLAGAQARLQLIEPPLSLSYEMLSEELRLRWRMLAVFPGNFDEAGAAAVWEVEDEAAREMLGEMIAFSLVEWNDDAGRYRLHDLARVFADSRLSNAERSVGARRHAEHYQRVLASADALYLKGGDGIVRGLALFDRERANIDSGQAWAAAYIESDESAATLCIAYLDAGAEMFHLRRHPREWIWLLEAMLTAARRFNRRDAERRALGNLGIAYQRLGDFSHAIEFYNQSLNTARETGDRNSEGRMLHNLGVAHEALGEPRNALELYEQALAIFREIGDRRNEGTALGNIGVVYDELGEPLLAIERHEQRLVIAREIGDRRGEATAFANLGKAHYGLGDPSGAIKFYDRQLAIAREISDPHVEAHGLYGKAAAIHVLGDGQQAIRHLETALRIYQQIEAPEAGEAMARLSQWEDAALHNRDSRKSHVGLSLKETLRMFWGLFKFLRKTHRKS